MSLRCPICDRPIEANNKYDVCVKCKYEIDKASGKLDDKTTLHDYQVMLLLEISNYKDDIKR